MCVGTTDYNNVPNAMSFSVLGQLIYYVSIYSENFIIFLKYFISSNKKDLISDECQAEPYQLAHYQAKVNYYFTSIIAYLSSKKSNYCVPQKIPGSFSDNFWETNKDKPTLRK